MTTLTVGDPAPFFRLPSSTGSPVGLDDYRKSRLIVYFYPAALTPGCTTQAVDFTASLTELGSAGLSVVGISPDPPERLATFQQRHQISFPLLSDPSLETLRAYGAYGTRKLDGKQVQAVIRSTFVVDVAADGQGTIAVAQYQVRASGHVERLKRHLGLTGPDKH